MSKGQVFAAYIYDGIEDAASFQQSWVDMLGHDLSHRQLYSQGNFLSQRCGTDGLEGARNSVVREFLKTECEWLFFVDTDMGFQPDTVDKLYDAADPVERPIVGGLCFAMRNDSLDGYGGFTTYPVSTIYDAGRNDNGFGFVPRRDYQRDALVQCSATGSACILIHRSVFTKIAAKFAPEQWWYDRIKLKPGDLDEGATVCAEDLSFCMRAHEVGCPTFVHTGVKTTHMKPVWLGEDRYLAETWPAPALEPVAVVVPVLSRPQNVPTFMDSLRASTGLATAYFVCDPDDHAEQDAVRKHGGKVLLKAGTFAQKANHGYKSTTEPWLLLVGDDVVFRPGWYDRALRAAGDRFHLVGTNDLSSLKRELAVHPLIRRSWVDEHGASWDGPGTIAHEGYGHCFVDNEWTAVAAQDHAMILAPDAVVEHLHPLFAKAETDPIYEKGQASYEADKALWEARALEHLTPKGFSVEASVAAYPRQWDTLPGIVKVAEDLDRYERIIEATRPEVLVETGTWTGASADWFATHGVDVITIDVEPCETLNPRVTQLVGSSTDPEIVAKVTQLVAGRRCMVVLDSDHSAPHVAAEMLAYAPLVTEGCYMVVEDGICRWVHGTPVTEFGPLDAIEQFLPRPGWEHDNDLLNLHPVSHHPGGWLKRVG